MSDFVSLQGTIVFTGLAIESINYGRVEKANNRHRCVSKRGTCSTDVKLVSQDETIWRRSSDKQSRCRNIRCLGMITAIWATWTPTDIPLRMPLEKRRQITMQSVS